MNRKELTNKIGMNVRKYRLEADLSQEGLSLSADLSPTYIGKLERGERCPNIDTIYKICEALEISIFDLLAFDKSELYSDKELNRKFEFVLKKLPQNKTKLISEIIDVFYKNCE